ncbi:MAG: PilN domain-containing protein [Chloroflexi bacterium]|nr:PilN domain-containing protein [Chloroflexota bacterium]
MPATVPAGPTGNAPIDLNILPPEYRPRGTPPGLLWFLLAAALLLATPVGLFLGARGAERRAAPLATDVARLEAARPTPRPASAEDAALAAALAQAQEAATALCAVRPTALAERADWPAVATALATRDPARLTITRLEQSGGEVVVEGYAAAGEDVTAYAQALAASGAVRGVIVEEPTALAATLPGLAPSATPSPTRPAASTTPTARATASRLATATPSPTPTRTPTRTATPIVDVYEPDADAPPPLTPGQPQQRAFGGAGDVDRAALPVRAGYVYHVETGELALGVDTVLSVLVDGATHENDDAAPGVRSSAVEFLARADGVASVTVTNKGLAGPAAGYRLSAREVRADAYEPDDYRPRPISPWEVQQRTFYPHGDVDRAELPVKAGRLYTVETRNLAVGVDTALSVLVHGALYQNDDVAFGERASRVVFVAQADGVAGITVTNLDQFGPERSYTLTAWEAPAPLTPSPAPATPTAVPPPTPACQDAHEPDDIIPRLMAVGESRLHTFCPAGDRDRAVFTAKPGYAYRIETTALAIGVDTVLEAQIGATRLTNDDRAPQNLSSALVVHNATASEAPVYITVWNKGSDGPAAAYTLLVSDAGAGDAYEPDDAAPVAMVPGSTQVRTFYPPGDVDRVTFVAKPGHRYAVHTVCSERPVDTVLTVRLEGVVASNDDRRPGDVCSYAEVQNDGAREAVAEVTVYNDGPYDPLAVYTLHVDDLGASGADAFEPDVASPPALPLGEAQRRTFFPEGDIDLAVLQVKAGRRYAVSTCGQVSMPPGTPAPPPGGAAGCPALGGGVDTVLLVGGPVRGCTPGGCQSDDAAPGSGRLNSRVEFDASADGRATVTVYNKGAFGMGQIYYILAEEIGPASTPVARGAAPGGAAASRPWLTSASSSPLSPGSSAASASLSPLSPSSVHWAGRGAGGEGLSAGGEAPSAASYSLAAARSLALRPPGFRPPSARSAATSARSAATSARSAATSARSAATSARQTANSRGKPRGSRSAFASSSPLPPSPVHWAARGAGGEGPALFFRLRLVLTEAAP